MVLVAGCAGFGGQETATPAPTPTTGSTDSSGPTDSPAGAVSNEPTAAANRSYTLFRGGISGSEAGPGSRAFVEGEPLTTTLNITNRESQRINYTAVIQLVRFNRTGSNATVVDRRTLDRSTATVGVGEKRTITPTVTPNMTGQELLLSFLLYESDPPATPTTGNSYKYFGVPITVNSSQQ